MMMMIFNDGDLLMMVNLYMQNDGVIVGDLLSEHMRY